MHGTLKEDNRVSSLQAGARHRHLECWFIWARDNYRAARLSGNVRPAVRAYQFFNAEDGMTALSGAGGRLGTGYWIIRGLRRASSPRLGLKVPRRPFSASESLLCTPRPIDHLAILCCTCV